MVNFNIVGFFKSEVLAEAKKKEVLKSKHEGIKTLKVKVWQKDGVWVVGQKTEYTKAYQEELDNLFS